MSEAQEVEIKLPIKTLIAMKFEKESEAIEWIVSNIVYPIAKLFHNLYNIFWYTDYGGIISIRNYMYSPPGDEIATIEFGRKYIYIKIYSLSD